MRNKQNDKDYPNKMDSLYLCITTYIHNYCIYSQLLHTKLLLGVLENKPKNKRDVNLSPNSIL